MRKMFLTAMGAAIAIFGASRPADASLILSVSGTGGATVTCDNSLGSCVTPGFASSLNANTMFFTGTVGQFSVAVTIASSNVPGAPTGATLAITSVNVQNIGATAGVFSLDLTGQGYTMPSSTIMALTNHGDLSTSTGVVPGAQSVVQAAGAAEGTVIAPILTNCTMTNIPNDSCSSPSVLWTRADANGLFSLHDILTFNLQAGQIIQSGGSNLAATAVPEPASMLLLGSGLLVAGRRLRKGKKQ